MSNKAQDPKKAVATVEEPTTEANKIWEEIKDLPIDMFALPNQVVSQHATPLPFEMDPNRLFLSIRSTSTLPALETAIEADVQKKMAVANAQMAAGKQAPPVKKYAVELMEKYVVVSRVVSILPTKK